MQATAKKTVNIVLYTEGSNFDATSLVSTVWNVDAVNGVATVHSDDQTTNIFLRWNGGNTFTNPVGVTDVLIVHIPQSVSDFSNVEAYVDARGGIPVKILLSQNEDLRSWEQSRGFRFTTYSSDLISFGREGLEAFETRLQTAWGKHDTSGAGVNAEQFTTIAAELGVDTGSEGFAKSSQANFAFSETLDYSSFRQWYIFGRNDPDFWFEFSTKAGMVRGLIQAKVAEISKIFDTVSSETAGETGNKGKIHVRPLDSYAENFRVGFDMLSGDEFDKSVQNAPFVVRSSPFTVSLEIGVVDPEGVDQAIAMLSQFKEMGKAMIPHASDAVKMGVDLQFRLEENRFFFDFVVSGLLGGVIQETASRINFQAIKYSGLADFHISSNFSPVSVISSTLDDLVKSAAATEILFSGEVVNTRTVLRIAQLILGLLNAGERRSKDLNTAIAFLNAFRYTGLDIQYQQSALFDAIKETINTRSSKPDKWGFFSEQWTNTQGMLNAFVEQGKGFAMFLADYAMLLKNINLDTIRLHIRFPIVRTAFRFTLRNNDLTNFINTNFLNF